MELELMENDILESLEDLGYKGPLLEDGALTLAASGGATSPEYTKLCAWLVSELRLYCKLEENVQATNSPSEADEFQLEVSGLLGEMNCPYTTLTSGDVTKRLLNQKNCLLLLTYLISELEAARMLHVNAPPKKAQEGTGSEVFQELKGICIALGMSKPPANITMFQFFNGIEKKLKETLAKVPSNHVGKPLLSKPLGPVHWTPSLEHPKMSTAKKAKTDSGRSFQEAWTESFGVIECNGKALCILCNESVVCCTSGVRRHFDTNHKSVAKLGETERKEFLEGKLRKYHSQYLSFFNYLSRRKLTAASFQISLCIAKHSKPLSDGDIIKTAMLSGSNSLFHDFPNKDKIIQCISEMPLSRNTVKDRVQHVASDVSQQLTTDLQKAAYYSMCLDESTDINDHARLAVILCYAVGDIMREELVKLVSLPERTQGIDIYNAVMEAFLSQDLRPEKVVSITSDGAPSMVGATSGFI